MHWSYCFVLALVVCFSSAFAQDPIEPIPRRIPPVGIDVPDEVRQQLLAELDKLDAALADLDPKDRADIQVLLKGVRFALINGEFYQEKDFETAKRHLDLAGWRYTAIKTKMPLMEGRLKVRGYVSNIDDSVQPYGLEIPEEMNFEKPAPLLVWLHGRGDKITDLHFIERCLTRSQAFGGKIGEQTDWVVLHPFGRQCIGWKHAGEIDVFDAIADVKERYNIDPERVVLAGFSMGGAGAWHIGAHYTSHFAAVHAGAGFAETKLYNKLKPEDYPPSYEQTLWGLYDAPNYARNFLNLPVVAYSGEEDKQKQAADVMEAELAKHGLQLQHIIGPGMGHKYHDDSVPPILDVLSAARNDEKREAEVELQTRTVRYGWQSWIGVTGLEEHWKEATVSASKSADRAEITTKNVTHLEVAARLPNGSNLTIDGQNLNWPDGATSPFLEKKGGEWTFVESGWRSGDPLRKRWGLQGPIDDAFMAPFLVVTPLRESRDPRRQRWLEFEIAHFKKRWRELMRGELRIKPANEVTSQDIERFNLICFGDPDCNPIIATAIPDIPITWDRQQLQIAGESFDPKTHIPALIYPNPQNQSCYIVINSGLTFREGHDRTNSLQNPKLPDWAVFDIRQDPNNLTAGKVVAADFFDESWSTKP
ncbi:MAG: alpha/beta hydrolase-fold protein [Verrucomicrobiota bacterium]